MASELGNPSTARPGPPANRPPQGRVPRVASTSRSGTSSPSAIGWIRFQALHVGRQQALLGAIAEQSLDPRLGPQRQSPEVDEALGRALVEGVAAAVGGQLEAVQGLGGLAADHLQAATVELQCNLARA